MRPRRVGAEERRVAELIALYGSDHALGVYYDEEEGVSLLPNGGRAAVCTDCARFIGRKEPGTTIVGYSHEDNPSDASELAFGHDFAIVDDRYIVDPWVVETAGYRPESQRERCSILRIRTMPPRFVAYTAIRRNGDSSTSLLPQKTNKRASCPNQATTRINRISSWRLAGTYENY